MEYLKDRSPSSNPGCTTQSRWSRLLCLLFLVPGVAYSATFYTAKSGADSNTCAQAANSNSPKLTIAAGIGCLGAGDTLVVKGGTYEDYNLGGSIPNGSAQNPTIIKAEVGETVTLRMPDSMTPGIRNQDPSGTGGPNPIRRCFYFSGKSYITIDGINCDGNGWRAWDGIKSDAGSNNIVFRNLFVTGAWNVGVKVNGANSHEFQNCRVYRNGSSDFRHGFYISGDRHKIWRCDIYENAGWGITIYGGASRDFADVRYNRVWGNGTIIGPRGDGIQTQGSHGVFINNLVWNNASGGIVLDGGTNNKALHNTVYANGEYGGYKGLHVKSSNSAARNNIVYLDSIFNSGSGNTVTSNFTSDPAFVSESVNELVTNFRLQSGSAAIGLGSDMTGEVADDFDGVSRTETPGFDIGAFEYTTNSSPPGSTAQTPNPPLWANN